MNKLVSIITPCYNGEKFIDGYFKSILSQEYTNCQMIFMDDGSTDRTKEMVMKYKPQIEDKGMLFEYHYHENIGLGATIAKGIQYVKGDYYIWPDIDDFLTSDSIRKRVDFLEKNPSYGLVRSDCKVVLESDLDTAIEYSASKLNNRFIEDLFIECLLMRNFYYQPGCYMIRTKALLDVNPNRFIFPSRDGQDIQMLLPLLYKYKCGYIDEPLFIYVRRGGSMSNSIKQTLHAQIKKWNAYEKIMEETIINTKIGDQERNLALAKAQFAKRKIDVAFENYDKKAAAIFYKDLKKIEGKNHKYYYKMIFANNKLFHLISSLRRKAIAIKRS